MKTKELQEQVLEKYPSCLLKNIPNFEAPAAHHEIHYLKNAQRKTSIKSQSLGTGELVRETTKSLLWTSTDVTALSLDLVQSYLLVTSVSAK